MLQVCWYLLLIAAAWIPAGLAYLGVSNWAVGGVPLLLLVLYVPSPGYRDKARYGRPHDGDGL